MLAHEYGKIQVPTTTTATRQTTRTTGLARSRERASIVRKRESRKGEKGSERERAESVEFGGGDARGLVKGQVLRRTRCIYKRNSASSATRRCRGSRVSGEEGMSSRVSRNLDLADRDITRTPSDPSRGRTTCTKAVVWSGRRRRPGARFRLVSHRCRSNRRRRRHEETTSSTTLGVHGWKSRDAALRYATRRDADAIGRGRRAERCGEVRRDTKEIFRPPCWRCTVARGRTYHNVITNFHGVDVPSAVIIVTPVIRVGRLAIGYLT